MTITTEQDQTIAPKALAERLAAGERMTILDIRADASWQIEGPGVTVLHRPEGNAVPGPASLAGQLEGPIVVVCNRGISAGPVARALRSGGADAVVLEDGMRGWIGALRAVPVETGIDGLSVTQVQRPGRGCLSYVLVAGERALVVDPAPDADFYLTLARDAGARISDVVDTHLHADHLSGARELAGRSGATLRLPKPALERGVTYGDRVEPLADGDEIDIGRPRIRALALPGHTSDMTGLVVGERVLIGGDSLFADGIARPDLQRGDHEGAAAMARELHSTLHERVLALGDDALLLPGHAHPGVPAGAITATLGEVRARVPELAIEDPGEFAEALLTQMPPRPANYESVIAVNSGTHPFDPELETGGNSCSTR